MTKQSFNPYLPSYEYIPDGEPHVFGERIYIYGSHDRFNGAEYCLNDYVCWSADVHDLTNWRYEGVIFEKVQDPRNQNIPADTPKPRHGFGVKPAGPDSLNAPGIHAMWAPDVVKGLDDRYYLYYCLDYLSGIGVAVCDTPAGKYEYLGLVHHEDGIPLGVKEGDPFQFDPGIFIDSDHTIYLYSGSAPKRRKKLAYSPNKGSQVMTLMPDMVTLQTEPNGLLPSVFESNGTGFEGHEFFEASSIRKINGKYYFIYSSVNSHELCYAISSSPDKGYRYGGTIVDIGDVFLNGRTQRNAINAVGNTHGSVECIDGQYYVFYHRQTNRTDFSRQGCAEKIEIDSDGSIKQVEVTSCGLNKSALVGKGLYPARICCHLTRKGRNIYSNPLAMRMHYPFLTQDLPDIDPGDEKAKLEDKLPIQYVANLKRSSTVGYKYFDFCDLEQIKLQVRGKARGKFVVTTELKGESYGEINVKVNSDQWTEVGGSVSVPDGVHALYFTYDGGGHLDLVTLELR